MNDYCCQILSKTGRFLEVFYPTLDEARQRCDEEIASQYTIRAVVFLYPDMDTVIYPTENSDESKV